MKTTLALTFTLLPAALALPSHNGHGQGHSHAYKAYKSGQCSAGAALPSGTAAGAYDLSNDTASGSFTGYITSHYAVYETVTLPASSGPSEAPAAVPAGDCGGTTTLTNINTVTVTDAGQEAESATSVAPTSTAPEVAPTSTAPQVAPVQKSPVIKPVAPISQASVPVVENLATPSAAASSSTAAEAAPAASPSIATPKSDAAAASPPGGKRGLFIPVSGDATQGDYVTAFNNNPGKISWVVNQFSGPPPGLSSEFNFVPQCYDKFSDDSKPGEAPHPWTTNAQKAVATGTEKFFLSFGEPNTNNSQGFYMDATEGAQEFMKMLQPYAVNDGITIGSPGTLGGPDDVQWQKDFLSECAGMGCKIGFVACHWFSPCGSATAQELADTMYGTVDTYKQIAQQYGLKVWVDNFSLNCDANTISQFLDIVVPKMDADDMIERYGYVSMTDVSQSNGFINTDGSLSTLGQHYATM